MNKYKKFIKDAYNGKIENLTMCQDWKQKIESEFPELLKIKNQELEINKWYKDLNRYPSLLFCFSGEYGNCTQYGFNRLGGWCETIGCHTANKYELATKEEVTHALVKEAEKRGFKKGVTIKRSGINKEMTFKFNPINGVFKFYANSNILDSDSEGHIFHNGKWAEIIENRISRAEAEKQLNAKIID